MSDLIQEECSKCGASFTRSPELTVCPQCGARIRGSWSRSRFPLVVWVVWGLLPVELAFCGILWEAILDMDGHGFLFVALVGGPIILYVWSLVLLESPKRGALARFLPAVPLTALMFGVNLGLVFAGCLITMALE